VSEGRLYWVDFFEGRVVIFVFDARKIANGHEGFDDELEEIEFAGEEEARGEGVWGPVDRCEGL
jgi:hypothetical protein